MPVLGPISLRQHGHNAYYHAEDPYLQPVFEGEGGRPGLMGRCGLG
jgi:hypothetical protein